MITTYDALDTFCSAAREAGSIALDTEFQRERRYAADLQLVQVATREEATLIDPLAIDDLSPLWDLVADEEVEVLLHDAMQDLEIFYRACGMCPRAIVDTQVAAAMLGMGEQPGYGVVVKQTLGVKLAKGARVSDWSKRPLSRKQATYALDDVRYLHPIWDQLRSELERLGRREWLQLELSELEDVSRFEPDPGTLWTRVSGRGKVNGRSLAVLQELAAWREEEAERVNIPRRHVLADDILIGISRKMPESHDELGELRRLSKGALRRHGDALLECVERGASRPRESWPKRPRKVRLNDEYGPLLDLLKVYVRHRARELSIASNYLATTSDLRAFVAHVLEGEPQAPPKVLRGWRRRMIGDEMRELLSGKLSFGFDPDTSELAIYEE